MEKKTIKTNSSQAWLLAARPVTLTCAAAPILVALTNAWHDLRGAGEPFHWIPAILCLLFAFMMQIDANFINDYFDFVKGVDREDRLGPKRACAEGWITPSAMRTGIALTTLIACLIGMPLIWYGGTEMIAIGIACVLFSFLYTTTLARRGLGDVLVLLFFGIVPVGITYYIQTQVMTTATIWLALSIGLATDTLLIVNNYRDRDTDVISGKRTLVILIGAQKTEWLYLALGIIACLCCIPLYLEGKRMALVFSLVYLIPHVLTWRKMVSINQGKQLNEVLGATARNIFILGILISIGLLF